MSLFCFYSDLRIRFKKSNTVLMRIPNQSKLEVHLGVYIHHF